MTKGIELDDNTRSLQLALNAYRNRELFSMYCALGHSSTLSSDRWCFLGLISRIRVGVVVSIFLGVFHIMGLYS